VTSGPTLPPPPPPPPVWGPPGSAITTAFRDRPSEPFRSLRGLRTSLVLLLVASGFGGVLQFVTQRQLRSETAELLVDDRPIGSFAAIQRLIDLEDRANAANGLALLFLVATGVVFIVWSWRARKNLDALGETATMAAGWTIGGWFTPFGNLVVPFVAVLEIAYRSRSPRARAHLLVSALWWAAFAAMSITRIAATTKEPDATAFFSASGVRRYLDARDLWSASGLIATIGAGLAIGVVMGVTQVQHSRRASQLASP
jgi:Domain of unknown function (DUF4328)